MAAFFKLYFASLPPKTLYFNKLSVSSNITTKSSKERPKLSEVKAKRQATELVKVERSQNESKKFPKIAFVTTFLKINIMLLNFYDYFCPFFVSFVRC